MRTFFAVFTLALLLPAGAATLSHPRAKEAGSGIYDLSETNAQLIVSVAGRSLLPEASEDETHPGQGDEQLASLSADAAQIHAFLRSLRRAAVNDDFSAATSDPTGGGPASGDGAEAADGWGEDSQAVLALRQSGVVAVPEPSTYALLGAGALLLAFKARRR